MSSERSHRRLGMLAGTNPPLVFLVDFREGLDAERFCVAHALLGRGIVDAQAPLRIEHVGEGAVAVAELAALDPTELLHGNLAPDEGGEILQNRSGRRLRIFVEQAHRARDDDLGHRAHAIVAN